MNLYPQEPTQPVQSYYNTYGYDPYSVPPPPPPPPPAPRHYGLIAILVAMVLLVAIVGVVVAYQFGRTQASAPSSAAIATSTTGATPTLRPTTAASRHITAVHTGTGFDQNTGSVIGETSTFHVGDTVWVVYTVTNPDPGAQVILKLYNNGAFESISNPVVLDAVTNTYANSLQVQQTGVHEVELDYNGVAEASVSFTVS